MNGAKDKYEIGTVEIIPFAPCIFSGISYSGYIGRNWIATTMYSYAVFLPLK